MVGYLMVVLVLLLGSPRAQEVEDAWQAFLSAHEALDHAHGELNRLENEASVLREEVESLQEKSTWVTGWFTKMRLARKGRKQVEVSDSLRSLQREIELLDQNRRTAFYRLRDAYRTLLDQSVGQQGLSEPEKEIGVSMVKVILSRQENEIEFPQYGSLLEQEFGDEKVRAMVLKDLQGVLVAKIGILDSLLTERRLEQELIQRVNEFHLGLKMLSETEFDPGSGVSKGAAASPEGFSDADVSSGPDGYREEGSFSKRSPLGISSHEKQVSPDDRLGMALRVDPIQSEIVVLESKRREYRDLLEKIRYEVAY